MTRNGTYLDFKAEHESELYVPADQIIGHRVDELMPTDLGRKILDLVGEVLDSGEVRMHEYELQKQAGLRSYEARISVSGPDEVVAIVRDVTEPKLLQRELRQTAERLKAILGNLPVVLFALDMDGRFTLSEGNGLDLLGLSPGDMLGKSVFEAYADNAEFLSSFRRALAGEEFTTDRDYEGRSFQTRYAPMRDETDALVGTIGVTIDVTEQVATERALIASESRFRLLMEHSNDVLCELRDGRITYISPNCFELSGKAPEYYIGRSPGELAHKDDLPKLARFVAPGWIGHISETFRVRHADGDWRWREVSGVRIIEDDRPRAVLVLRDVDARMKAEDAARSVEQRYAEVVSAARDVVYSHDLAGRFTSVNPAASALYGYTTEDLLQMNFASFVDPAHVPIAVENMQRALRGEPMIPVQLLTYARDKTARWVEVVASPIVERGDVVGFQGIARDITDRKKADERVRFQAQLLDLVSQAVIVTDLEGGLTFWNRFAEEMYGFSAEELMGRSLLEFGLPGTREKALEIMARVAGGENWTGELTATRRNGETFPGLFFAAPIYDAAGQLSGGVCVSVDISELRRAEREVHRAEERSAVLGERARIAQELHDNVAQYFFGIGIAAKDMLERKPAPPATLRRRLAHIRKLSTVGGREVRNAIQALSSTELADGLDVALTRLFATYEETSGAAVGYRNDLGTPVSPSIARDLYAAARETLYNIRKHAAASTISVRLYGDAGSTRLEVADDGIGTAVAIHESVASGDGFGLRSLCERFELHGGRVDIVDRPSGGVAICCTLPVEAA